MPHGLEVHTPFNTFILHVLILVMTCTNNAEVFSILCNCYAQTSSLQGSALRGAQLATCNVIKLMLENCIGTEPTT